MSAELVDPFATPRRPVWSDQERDGMIEAVRDQLVWTKREDPGELARDLVRKTLHELRQANTTWADGLLEQLWHRAESGVPYSWSDEPVEPAWSLDKASTWQGRNISDAVEDL